MRIIELDRRVAEGGYADPRIFPRMEWRDLYQYGPTGELTGWIREDTIGRRAFDAEGHGPNGRPNYALITGPGGVIELKDRSQNQ